MGLLDNLVSDLVKSSTGINARSFVRMVGGKNILLLGGAAVAGALAASQMGQQQPPIPTTPGRTVPPPPPPPPVPTTGTAAPPPPPVAAPQTPEPMAEGDETLPRELLCAIVRTMVTAALADGRLADEEKSLIEKRLDGSGLSQEQVHQVQVDMENPPPVEKLAALVSNREDAELLYRFGSLVVLADKNVSDLERTWLGELARALEIPPRRQEMLEWEVFS